MTSIEQSRADYENACQLFAQASITYRDGKKLFKSGEITEEQLNELMNKKDALQKEKKRFWAAHNYHAVIRTDKEKYEKHRKTQREHYRQNPESRNKTAYQRIPEDQKKTPGRKPKLFMDDQQSEESE